MEEDLRKLKAARGQAKSSITNICNFTSVVKNLQECTYSQLLVKKDRLVEVFQKYCDYTIDISVLDISDKEEFLEYEEKYFCALSALTEYLTMKQGYSASTSGNASTSLTNNNNHTFQRLPPIDIKKFSGKVCEYYDFINLFTSVIANNSSLSSCDKFYYLKSSLEGEAADVIKHLGLNSENYSVALQLLAERYDNKTKMINYHISALLDIECLTKCTAPALRNIVAQTKQHLAALKTLKVPTDQWDLIIICILQRKLDQQTLRYYYLELKDGLHNLDSFLKFIEQRAAAYETVADGYSSSLKRGSAVSGSRTASLVTTTTQNSNNDNKFCKFCNSKYHLLHQCEKFKLSSYSDRINFVESNKLCQLCLRLHTQKCRYAFRCSICKERHNSLLHQEKKPKQVALSMNMGNNILLPTLNVRLYDKSGNVIYTKALCDSGSQVSLVLHDLTKSIDCNLYNEQSVITGICNEANNISQKAEFKIHSTTNEEALTLSCCVVENITCNMPQFPIDLKELNIPEHVQLGDKHFYKKEKIGILLGCDIFFQLLLRDQIPIVPGSLCLYKTLFGYVVAGKVPRQGNTIQGEENSSSSHFLSDESESQQNLELLNNLNTNISQLWECEKITETFTEANTEQELAEKIYKETVELKDGRFHVSLTLKQDYDKIKLGDSLTRALQRFHNLEKRFAKDRDLFLKYKAFIDEYISLGHAQYIDIEKYTVDGVPFYILPHHPVFNNSSKTTKMRVVFDGGMRTNENVSLNDILLNGPTVQNELFNILTLFRFHKYVLISDIKMMFRNLMLDEKHCSLQNILWRESPEENIKAIHIELASSLTTECFLQCLKRFIARRNKPSVIYCDNASTFKGANNELNGLYKLQASQQHQDLILDFTTSAGIDFSFIPSYSPVFGGLWEAGIKSAKGHIKRVVGKQILTYEELNSVVIQIEGILNSRPLLSLQTADFNNMSYITPGHFLTGATLSTVPEPNITNIPINRLKFWNQCSHMTQCFWKSWSREYLMQLQSRPKWRKPLPNISKGMLVILRVDNAPPLVWPMARVVETFPGADGKVRALSVITPKGTVMRTSIGKVCLLPIEDNQHPIS